MRINKFIAKSGFCSRRKADDYIKDSKVKVNGVLLDDLSYQVKNDDIVEVCGKTLNVEDKIYIAINKPVGYTSTVKDTHAKKKVVDLINVDERLYPVGRLDKDSCGLLILTNDGEFTFELTHPKFMHKKVYEVIVRGKPKISDIRELSNGITIDGYKLKKSKIKFDQYIDNNSKYIVTIYEGRNRQIRKMFDHIHHPVLSLKRIQIGDYKLDDNLKPGQYVILGNEELNKIRGNDDRS